MANEPNRNNGAQTVDWLSQTSGGIHSYDLTNSYVTTRVVIESPSVEDSIGFVALSAASFAEDWDSPADAIYDDDHGH